MGTVSFLAVKCGQGVLLTTHPLVVPGSWKSRAIPLPILGHTGPVTGSLYLFTLKVLLFSSFLLHYGNYVLWFVFNAVLSVQLVFCAYGKLFGKHSEIDVWFVYNVRYNCQSDVTVCCKGMRSDSFIQEYVYAGWILIQKKVWWLLVNKAKNLTWKTC